MFEFLSDPRTAIASRELRTLSSEKTIVLAIGIQLLIAAFSSFLVVGFVSLYDPGSTESIEVEVGVAGADTDNALEAIEQTEGVTGEPYPSFGAAQSAFGRGEVDAVLFVQSRSPSQVTTTAIAPDGNVQTTIVVVKLRETLRNYEQLKRNQNLQHLTFQPLDMPPKTGSNPYFGFTYAILLPLLVFLPVFISGTILVDSLSEEREQGTLELLRVGPVTLSDITDGKLAVGLLLAPAQALTWMGLLMWNGTPIANLPLLLAMVTGLTALVCACAVVIGLAIPDRRSAQISYSILALTIFGLPSLSAVGPASVAGRLAIDTSVGVVGAAALGYLAVGIGALFVSRVFVRRLPTDTL